jgi:hypothetical protein
VRQCHVDGAISSVSNEQIDILQEEIVGKEFRDTSVRGNRYGDGFDRLSSSCHEKDQVLFCEQWIQMTWGID